MLSSGLGIIWSWMVHPGSVMYLWKIPSFCFQRQLIWLNSNVKFVSLVFVGQAASEVSIFSFFNFPWAAWSQPHTCIVLMGKPEIGQKYMQNCGWGHLPLNFNCYQTLSYNSLPSCLLGPCPKWKVLQMGISSSAPLFSLALCHILLPSAGSPVPWPFRKICILFRVHSCQQ